MCPSQPRGYGIEGVKPGRVWGWDPWGQKIHFQGLQGADVLRWGAAPGPLTPCWSWAIYESGVFDLLLGCFFRWEPKF